MSVDLLLPRACLPSDGPIVPNWTNREPNARHDRSENTAPIGGAS